MDKKYLDYARVVSVMAQQGALLDEAIAQQFCAEVVPVLISEIEVLERMVNARADAAIPAPPCEATVCSSRWVEQKPEKATKKKAKPAKKKPAKKPAPKERSRKDAKRRRP